jgi:hypothetical protein
MLNILPNQTFTLDPVLEARDTGWILSGGTATHYPCNPGTMKSVGSEGLVVGKTYVVTYEVTMFDSGSVKVLLGTTSGTSRTAAGIYTENLVCAGVAQISFFSDGYLTIQNDVSFYELVETVDNSVTLAFYEGDKDKKWTSHYSYSPEMMIKFVNSFFCLKNGALWLQNSNEVRNNFFGVQYTSQIQFYDNLNPTTHKLYYSMRVEANTRWFCPNSGDISLTPVLGRQSGMASRLKRNNFQNYQGSFFADFMRNYLDSRFIDPENALFNGEPLRGRVMELNMTNDDTTEAILVEIDVNSSPSMITY